MIPEGYNLIKRIGAGTFGEVWRAEAPGGVDVAVKVIFRPISDEEVRRELDALNLIKKIRHPYLLQTQAYWLADDRLHIAMELADGCLRDRLRENAETGETAIPFDELSRYFCEAAEALDFLHGQRVLHRDVKPENILVLQRHAKVADFGLARLLQSNQNSASASGAGTPRYMAPEVWHNRVSPASDQYSLALTYLEIRLGRHVKEGGNMLDWMMFHTHETPDLTPLSDAEQQVVLRAIAKDPGARYPSCLAFAHALAALESRTTAAPRKRPVHTVPQFNDDLGTLAPVRQAAPTPTSPSGVDESRSGAPDDTADGSRTPLLPVYEAAPVRPRITPLVSVLAASLIATGAFAAYWFYPTPAAPPARSFVIHPAKLQVRAGESGRAEIQVERQGVSDAIKLTIDGLPGGLSADAATIAATSDRASVEIRADRDVKAGTHHVGVHGASGDLMKASTLELTIDPPAPERPKAAAWLPMHGAAPPGAELVTDHDGREWYDRIRVALPSGLAADFVLIPRKLRSDPSSFYIMANKVTVGQFRAFASAAPLAITDSRWLSGAKAGDKDLNNSNERHPVFRVTAVDALAFARSLGGNLPTVRQWEQAAGKSAGSPSDGPYRGVWDSNSPGKITVRRGSDGPLPVGESEQDVSPFGCYDMAGNGREWTRDIAGAGNRTLPLPSPTDEDRVILRGKSYASRTPWRFADGNAERAEAQYYLTPSPYTTFRVVIEPPAKMD